MQEWYLGWEKGTLFREVSSVQECPVTLKWLVCGCAVWMRRGCWDYAPP